MKINWELEIIKREGEVDVSTMLTFNFLLERSDRKKSISNNVGNQKVRLGMRSCMFELPFEIESIHNDLIAFAALKIVSPFIGKNFYIEGGVSKSFSKWIIENYKNIKSVNTNDSLLNYIPKGEGHAISFSGGTDSVAASLLDPNKSSPLVLSHIVKHPGMKFIGRNTNAQKMTLEKMPDTFNKIVVKTDFPFVTLSWNKKSTTYSDSFVFTLPIVLLSEHLGFNKLITGDILEAFTSNLTNYNEDILFECSKFHESVGIKITQPLKGMSEIITTGIVHKNKLNGIAVSCENSRFDGEKVITCNRCSKCFRKGIFNWAINKTPLSSEEINSLEESAMLDEFALLSISQEKPFGPCYKWAFEKIDNKFNGKFEMIRKGMLDLEMDATFVNRIFMKPYEKEDDLTISFLKTALEYFEPMNEKDIENFKTLNMN